MAGWELIDTGTDERYVRRDERGRFKGSDDAGRSLRADRRRIITTPEIHGGHPPAEPATAQLYGVTELVAATREQTAAIERQTAAIERVLAFLSPAGAARDRQEAARDLAETDAAVRPIG
jgi:hypothetical protein